MKKGFLVTSAVLSVVFLTALMTHVVYAYDYTRYDTVCDHNSYGEGSEYDQYTATGLTGEGWASQPSRWYHGIWWFQRGYKENCEWGPGGGPYCYWKIGSNNYFHAGGGEWYTSGGYHRQDHFENHYVSSNYLAGKVTSYFRVPWAYPPSYWLIGYQWAELWR